MTCVERALYRAHDALTVRMFAGGLGPVGRAALVAVRCALDKAHAERVAVVSTERAAHALTRARLEAAERVVEAARALEVAVLCEAGARESMHAPRAVLSAALTHRADVLAALDAAASSRAGDDS